MEFVRKHKKISITVMIVLFIILILGLSFGRYLYNIINNYILETKAFYFNSSVLGINNNKYLVNNWDGVNSYTLTINVNNMKNSLVYTDSDITYETYVECSNNVTCTLSTQSSVIYKNDHNDSYIITVVPKHSIAENEEVTVYTRATATSPFTKSLDATYTLTTVKSNFSYEIIDKVGSKYLELDITNSLTYYKVQTAFGDYSVNDQLSLDEYAELTTAEKANCYSAIVTLSWNPNLIYLDMTANEYLNRTAQTTQQINGYTYVNSFTYRLDAISSSKIIFYKPDISLNYTYPITNPSSIVTVNATLAG